MRPGSTDLQAHERNSSRVLHSPVSPSYLTRLSNRQLLKFQKGTTNQCNLLSFV